jgi:RNA polymerase sigma factor (sigma-70 family)
MTESALIARAAAGDTLAFGVLMRTHQAQIRGFLLRLTGGDHAFADDLAQETFLAAFRKLAQFRSDGSFAGWLCRIAYSRFLMEVRRRKPPPDGDAEGEFAHADSPSLARLDLERAMQRLAPAERAALTLCYALGFSHDEAAGILKLPLGTLKSHVLRGREKLKRLLESWSPEA